MSDQENRFCVRLDVIYGSNFVDGCCAKESKAGYSLSHWWEDGYNGTFTSIGKFEQKLWLPLSTHK